MITKKGIYFSIACGIITGLIMSYFFKAIEIATSYKVYTLLLNIDYIPILKDLQLSEFAEVGLHLFVSIFLTVCLYLFLCYSSYTHKLVLCSIICVIVGILLYPTTLLSDRTPPFTSIPSILLWVTGHLLYGLALGTLFHFAPIFSKTNHQ